MHGVGGPSTGGGGGKGDDLMQVIGKGFFFKMYYVYYGNTCCTVFKLINILKGNYCILRIGLTGASEVFKNQSFKSQKFSSSHDKIPQFWGKKSH